VGVSFFLIFIYMRYIVLLLALITLNSCGTYYLQKSPKKPEIKSLLAVTSEGDTIQVSTDDVLKQIKYNSGTYSNWQFYWDNSWYWGSGWYNLYDPYWRWRIYRNNPLYNYNWQPRVPRTQTPKLPPRYRPKRNTPQRVEMNGRRGSTPNVQPNRGRSNQQRTPQYNRPTRSRTTPNVIQRPTQTKTNVGRRSTNSSRVIKQ